MNHFMTNTIITTQGLPSVSLVYGSSIKVAGTEEFASFAVAGSIEVAGISAPGLKPGNRSGVATEGISEVKYECGIAAVEMIAGLSSEKTRLKFRSGVTNDRRWLRRSAVNKSPHWELQALLRPILVRGLFRRSALRCSCAIIRK